MSPHELRHEEIYDALVDDGVFSALPSRLAAVFGARSALIHWVYSDGSADVLSHSGYFSDDQLRLYSETYISLDPWVQASTQLQRPNTALSLEDLVPVRTFVCSRFYNEYVRAMGDDTCRGMGIKVQNRWGSGFIAFQRGRSQPGYEADSVAALDQTAKHLRRMLSIRGRLAGASRHAGTLAAALDGLGDAVFLLSNSGVILHANAAARDILDHSGAFISRKGLLCARSSAADSQLKCAIARAVACSRPEAGAVRVPSSNGPPIEISLAAVQGSSPERFVLVTARTPCTRDSSLADRLRAIYKLSPGEAQLAIALAEGASPSEIANDRGVSLGTVRSQLKHISAKLDCHRQADIVRVVHSLPSLRLGYGDAPHD